MSPSKHWDILPLLDHMTAPVCEVHLSFGTRVVVGIVDPSPSFMIYRPFLSPDRFVAFSIIIL